MKKYLFLCLILALGLLSGCANETKAKTQAKTKPIKITVSAAASLQDAAAELRDIYGKEHPNVKITYNFAGSGTLQKQIEQGAPVDLFISAGQRQMDALVEKGLTMEGSPKDLLGNDLVLVAGNGSKISDFQDLAKPEVGKISIGTPESVPAGKYAQEAMQTLQLWDVLQPKLVLAKDVRQVLNYVETGNVEAGLVYRSDALGSEKCKIVATAPAESHKPIVYPLAILKSTRHAQEVQDFASFLSGAEAASIFEKYGLQSLRQ